MTVCVAAICVGSDVSGNTFPAAVVAADRMVTLGNFIEFEHAVPKMKRPSQSSIVMIAGDTLVGTRLAHEVADATSSQSLRCPDVAAALAQRYSQVRLERAEQQLLAVRGLNLGTYYQNHQSLSPQVMMMLDQGLANFDLGVALLLAGADAEGAHIFTIMNPGGGELRHDVIGYAAAGSGEIHALQSMIGFGHEPEAGLVETVFRVYASKRRAEVAPGVGHDTDLAIISPGGIVYLDEDQLNMLEKAYAEHEDSTKEALSVKLAGLSLDTETMEGGTDDESDAADDGATEQQHA